MPLHKKAADVTVFLNGVPNAYWKLLHCEQSAGGGRLDHAVFEVPRAFFYEQSQHFDNLSLNNWAFTEIEVGLTTAAGAFHIIHWGQLLQSNLTYGPGGDTVILESRTEPFHYGSPLSATPAIAPHVAANWQFTNDPIVLNPIIDDRVVGNAVVHPAFAFPLFCPADNANPRPGRATVITGGFPLEWNLQSAVAYFSFFLNPQTYIINGLIGGLNPNPALVRNVEIPYGMHLPQILDLLLTPAGYSWKVDYFGRGARRVRYFELGASNFKRVRMQAPGATADLNQSHIEEAFLRVDLSQSLINEVKVIGDYPTLEATFELLPGWDAAHDAKGTATDMDKLALEHPDWKTTPELANVWRRWVLNEAGDYRRHRVFNFTPYFGATNFTPRRRPFSPCIAFDPAENLPLGGRHGMILEWYDNASATWKPVEDFGPHGSWAPLDREAGIIFTGEFPPEQLIEQSVSAAATGTGAPTQNMALAKLRITASVRADARVQIDRTNPQSLLRVARGRVVDAPSQWCLREVHRSSINNAKIAAGNAVSTAVDDRLAMVAFADDILRQWSAASVDGAITMPGIDIHDYQVGDTLVGLAGRLVDFQLTSFADPIRRWPSVMSVRFDNARQATTLTVASMPVGPVTI